MSETVEVSRFKKLLSYFFPLVIETRPGQLSSQLEIMLHNGKLQLNSEKVNYSFGSLHEVFRRAFERQGIAGRNIRKALVLGYGAGSVRALLQETYAKPCMITAVEKDPEVVALARKYYPDYENAQVRLVQADAAEFVSSCREQFDLIIVDVFVDGNVPGTITAKTFLESLHGLLASEGLLLFNYIATEENRLTREQFESDFVSIFPKAQEQRIHLDGADNLVLAGNC